MSESYFIIVAICYSREQRKREGVGGGYHLKNLMGKWEPFWIFVGLISYGLRGAKYGLDFF